MCANLFVARIDFKFDIPFDLLHKSMCIIVDYSGVLCWNDQDILLDLLSECLSKNSVLPILFTFISVLAFNRIWDNWIIRLLYNWDNEVKQQYCGNNLIDKPNYPN